VSNEFNLHERIRSEGRAKLQTFSPSPELGGRIVTQTRARIRRRRQRGIAAMSAGIAALVVGGIVVLRPQPQRTVSPAVDSVAVTTITDDLAPTLTQLPTTTAEIATDPSAPTPAPSGLPNSFFTVDYFTYGATERALDGTVVRTFGVSPTPVAAELMPNGWTVALGDSLSLPTRYVVPDIGRCTNFTLRADRGNGEFTELHPDLPSARHIAIANGMLYAIRDVCPGGTVWGDPNTGWSLDAIDLNSPDVSPPKRLIFESAEASSGVAPSTVAELVVSPDGSRAAVWLLGEEYGWSVSALDDQARPMPFDGCQISGRPTFLETHLIVVPCSFDDGTIGVELTDAAGAPVEKYKVDGAVASAASASVFIDPANPAQPSMLVSGMGRDPNERTTVSLVHHSEVTVIATDVRGVAAWTLAELGLAEIGPASVPPETVPAEPVGDEGSIIRYDSELPGLPSNVVADSGMPEYVDSVAMFSQFGSGTAVVVQPQSGWVTRVTPDGRTWRNMLPVDDPAGPIQDIGLGPERTDPDTGGADPMLYVSRLNPDTDVYTLVAYGLSNDNELVNEFGRWETTWTCQETFCGNIVFTNQGVDLGAGQFAMAGTLDLPVLPEPVRGSVLSGPLSVNDCVDDAGYNLTAMTEVISYAGQSWVLAAECVQVQEGSYTRFQPQADGSVLAKLLLKRRSSENGRQVLVHLRADGSTAAYDIPVTYRDVAFVDGQLLAIEFIPSGNYRVVRLDPPN
jgi:hypothetical protein